MNGFKLIYQEKCKEWLREMFRTNKRKKPLITKQLTGTDQEAVALDDEEVDPEAVIDDDDIMLYDSDD